MQELKWLWSILHGYKRYLVVGLALSLFLTVANLANPLLIGRIVKDVFEDGKVAVLPKLLLFMLLLAGLRAGLRYIRGQVNERTGLRLYNRLREQMYEKLQKMDFFYFDRNRSGDLMAKMTSDTEVIRNFTCNIMMGVFENIIYFLFTFLYVCTINPLLLLAIFVCSPLLFYLTFRYSKRMRPIYVKMMEQYSRLNTVVTENVSGNRVVKAFTREAYETEKFQKENESYRNVNVEASATTSRYSPLLEFSVHLMIGAFWLCGGVLVATGKIALWQFITVNSYLTYIISPMQLMANYINETQRFVISADRILGVLRAQPLLELPAEPITTPVQGKVEFHHVDFAYPAQKPCLHDIDFTVEKGQTVGIVGATGAGKSSLVHLISRFYDVTAGEIRIDGQDIRQYDLQVLRQGVGMAMQEIFLFSDTVEGNISYGVPEAPMEEVVRVSSLAGAHDFVSRMPEAYNTVVGERGVGLSGGQKQRLSLARALCTNPSILILDDTTSAVDMETEREIQRALTEELRDKTTFIIAHRVSSVKNADLILVLEEGRIVERGTHRELLAKRGYYYDIYQTQVGLFAEESFQAAANTEEVD